jgi:hypothetical protein
MRELRTEIEIDAPPERVWQVLTDFGAYPEWNPFIGSIEGEPSVGARLKVRIEPPGARGMTLRPTVRAVELARELRWLSLLFLPGFVDGEHRLALEPLPAGARGSSRASVSAGCSSACSRGTLAATERGFAQMNDALKRRVEVKK